MFAIFSRKQQPAAKVSDIQSDAMAVDLAEPKQLRTPSPSEAAFNGLGAVANTTPTTTTMSPIHHTSNQPALPPPTPEALVSLVSPIPPKTLHAYVLAHIADSPPDTIATLASFFATLKPPPLLHCVRCHADYTEVDNDDRSCRVPHDDESANVEYVGRSGRDGCEYETEYDCCGKKVDGEGDLGPPDGWCYEGMHTVSLSRPFSLSPLSLVETSTRAYMTQKNDLLSCVNDVLQIDVRRARFRADSTKSDDKLVSCVELNCPNARVRLPKKSVSSSGPTKRWRPSSSEDDIGHDYIDCGYIGTEASGVEVIAHVVREPSQKSKGKGDDSNNKRKEMVGTRRRTKAVAKKIVAVRPGSRVRLQAPGETDSNEASKKAGSASAPAARVPSGRRRQPSNAKPRSKAPSPPTSPEPRGRKPPSVEIVLRSRSSTRSRVREGNAETGDEKTMADSEGKVRKRRKVAARAAA